MEQPQDSIQVLIRIRASTTPPYFAHSPHDIQLNKNSFVFDRIYAPDTSQEEIFVETGLKSMNHALEGYNSCIFVYGQTGSGKTYTMVGEGSGLIQRAMDHLFRVVSESTESEYVISCSYYEIYN